MEIKKEDLLSDKSFNQIYVDAQRRKQSTDIDWEDFSKALADFAYKVYEQFGKRIASECSDYMKKRWDAHEEEQNRISKSVADEIRVKESQSTKCVNGVFAKTDGKKPLVIKKMSEVEIKTTEFLYYPYFPKKLCIMSAYPGSGKTYIACRLAASASTGSDFLGVLPNTSDRKNVLYLSSEDGYDDTIAPRLIQCDADLDRIDYVDFDDSSTFDFADERLEEVIKQRQPELIIFDTLQNFIGDVNLNAANETTRKMRPLVRLADEYNCCIVCVCHFNKNEQGSAITRTIGSTDITGKCRSYLTVGNVPDEEGIKYLSHEKTNVGKLGDTLLFSISENGIKKEGISKLHSDDYAMMRRTKGKKSAPVLDEVKQFIINNMPNGMRKAAELETLLKANNISESTYKRAKMELGIESKKIGGFNDRTWYWVFPEKDFSPVDYSMLPNDFD